MTAVIRKNVKMSIYIKPSASPISRCGKMVNGKANRIGEEIIKDIKLIAEILSVFLLLFSLDNEKK